MKRFQVLLILGVMFCSALFAAGCNNPSGTAPDPNQDQSEVKKEPGSYFPLTGGSTWEYKGEGNEFASFTRRVLHTKDNRAQIKEDNPGTSVAAIYEVTEEKVTRVFSKGEVYEETNLLDQEGNEENVILKKPLETGTKWDTPNGTREIVDVDASVNTPAGDFEECIKVKVSSADSITYEYFKEGVGMVKQEFVPGQDPEAVPAEERVTSALEEYNIN